MEEVGRKYKRGSLIMPALLKDINSNIVIKAVILDISATGLRVVTNDKLVRMTEPDVLMNKTFFVDFDFFDVDTSGIEGRIANVKTGERHEYEKQLGIEFTKIEKTSARDINRIVLGNFQPESE